MVVGRHGWVSTHKLGESRVQQRADLLYSSHRAYCRVITTKTCVSVSSGDARSVGSTYLVVDGTNILSKVYGAKVNVLQDGKLAHGTGETITRYKPRDVFILWVEFLASYVGANAILCVFDHPANSRPGMAGHDNEMRYKEEQGYKVRRRKRQSTEHVDNNHPPRDTRRGSHLWEYREYFKRRGDESADMVISPQGHEADDAIRHIVHACTEELDWNNSSYHVYVASGDADLQECIDEHVSLLNILPFPTLTSPQGLECVTLDSFEWKEYFHPRQYRTFLTLVGKSESGIGGLGMSDTTAAKLVRAFGSIEDMLAAGASGRLKSWDSRVQEIFSGKNTRLAEKLKRNMRVFGGPLQSISDAVDFNHVRWMKAGQQNRPYRERRAHPMISMHWNLVEKDARDVLSALQSNVEDLHDITWPAQLSNGLSVDAALHACNNEVLYLFFVPTRDIKYQFDAMLFSNIISEAFKARDIVSIRDPFKMQKSIPDRSIARYIGLLKKSNQKVLIIPIYIS